ncbi:MAG: alpha/beta fold hydrolase [Thermoleophilaceae bacterium]
MPTIDLPNGTVDYRVTGPEESAAPPVVFVHGFLVNGSLWSENADALAAAGIRSYAPHWPLGAHRIALHPGADQSPRGVARHIVSFLDALDLEDVTLVGNDTGGAICQFVLDTDASRIGRLVLTNCDAFDHFPPAPFDVLFKSFRSATAIRGLMLPMKSAAVRHSPAGFGLLVDTPLDPEQTHDWIAPCLADAGVRTDVARFVKAVDPGELLDVAARLGTFEGPVLLVWGAADRFFKLELAYRLRDVFPDARLVEIEGGRTFVPHDHPERLAAEITAFAGVAQQAV